MRKLTVFKHVSLDGYQAWHRHMGFEEVVLWTGAMTLWGRIFPQTTAIKKEAIYDREFSCEVV